MKGLELKNKNAKYISETLGVSDKQYKDLQKAIAWYMVRTSSDKEGVVESLIHFMETPEFKKLGYKTDTANRWFVFGFAAKGALIAMQESLQEMKRAHLLGHILEGLGH